ncbi:MAG: hypothetical protein ABIJ14_01660 [Nanoarchaeota archaeon]
MVEEICQVEGLNVERTPSETLTTPENPNYELRVLLNDGKTTEYDTWCRHSD